jgi:hypothetical protein
MLDINLNDADTVKLTMLEITQFIDTVCFATGDSMKKGGGKLWAVACPSSFCAKPV